MPIGFTRSIGTNSIPVWQGIGKDIQLAQGGFALNATGLNSDTIIPAGTPFVFNETNRTATMVGGGSLQAAALASDTTYKVNKGSTYKVGDNFGSIAGGAAYPITAIDTSNSAYDVITVGTTLGVALAVGANTFASSATGATSAAYPAINGLLYDDTQAIAGESVSIVIRGTIYARRIPFAYSAALAALPALDDIIFSQSK